MNIQSLSDYQFLVPDLLTTKECNALIELSEKIGYKPASIKGSFEGSNGYSVRNGINNARAAIENLALAKALWNRIEEYVPKMVDDHTVTGLNERLRFYCYTIGQSFGPHTDGYFKRSNGEQSFLTLMIYLNDNFSGGETLFLKRERIIKPKAGAALIFTHRQWHAGLMVQSGCKYVLRTDVIYEPRNYKD